MNDGRDCCTNGKYARYLVAVRRRDLHLFAPEATTFSCGESLRVTAAGSASPYEYYAESYFTQMH
jgi:hypothetical protein